MIYLFIYLLGIFIGTIISTIFYRQAKNESEKFDAINLGTLSTSFWPIAIFVWLGFITGYLVDKQILKKIS